MRKFASRYALRFVPDMPRLAAAAMMLVVSGVATYAQEPRHVPEARIVVTGEGSVSVKPNYAQIRSGVTTRAKTVKEGVDANSKLMVAIVGALKGAGVAEKDIQTSRFSIQPVYAPQEPRTEPKLLGYNVSNQVEVTIRAIDRVGDVLDKVVGAGATDVGNVSFLVSDASKSLDEARDAAIADARRKAEVYAKAAGVQLGRVEWITEEAGGAPPVPMMARAQAAPVPIVTGEDTLLVHVIVGFDIAR
jgi:uncharacterized protein YggE